MPGSELLPSSATASPSSASRGRRGASARQLPTPRAVFGQLPHQTCPRLLHPLHGPVGWPQRGLLLLRDVAVARAALHPGDRRAESVPAGLQQTLGCALPAGVALADAGPGVRVALAALPLPASLGTPSPSEHGSQRQGRHNDGGQRPDDVRAAAAAARVARRARRHGAMRFDVFVDFDQVGSDLLAGKLKGNLHAVLVVWRQVHVPDPEHDLVVVRLPRRFHRCPRAQGLARPRLLVLWQVIWVNARCACLPAGGPPLVLVIALVARLLAAMRHPAVLVETRTERKVRRGCDRRPRCGGLLDRHILHGHWRVWRGGHRDGRRRGSRGDRYHHWHRRRQSQGWQRRQHRGWQCGWGRGRRRRLGCWRPLARQVFQREPVKLHGVRATLGIGGARPLLVRTLAVHPEHVAGLPIADHGCHTRAKGGCDLGHLVVVLDIDRQGAVLAFLCEGNLHCLQVPLGVGGEGDSHVDGL
mmetsp:Transcript_69597/g.225227  ORF Transcript_69597/g.225227 Transcript_69597/m.225227 type:complete len:472 (+) Transcript_69597:184-1599(+)